MERTHDELEKKLENSNATPMSLPLEFLKAITCDFSIESVLGEGGYGVVYKGVLQSGKIIAVKKLFEIRLKEETFQNEVRYLMGIRHQNVVQFVGYCAESRWEAIEMPSGSGRHIFAEIPKRLLCFEYVSNKSLDTHISDESLGLEWNMRYEIIKGICNGLHFLHEECHIVHLDLKPENILMDSTMSPKIADFGLSRIFAEQQSRIVTDNRAGTCGYMAPEYLTQGVISNKADIFSLGVIVIELITGHRDYPYCYQDSADSTATPFQQFTEKVLARWRNKFVSTANYKSVESSTQQLRLCIAIALQCVDPAMEKRPTAKDIIEMLNGVDKEDLSPTPLSESSRANGIASLATKPSCNPQAASDTTSEQAIPPFIEETASSNQLLDIHPLELCFPIKPNKLISCSVHLTNNRDKQVVFRLTEKRRDWMCFLKMPLYGIVPPRSTYTLVVTTVKRENLPKETEVDLILHNVLSDEHIAPFESGYDWDQYFEKAKELENSVHMMALKAIYAPHEKKSHEDAIPTMTLTISREIREERMISLAVNQTEQWILTGHHGGYIDISDYDMQRSMGSVNTGDDIMSVNIIKFIERKQWFVVGSLSGHVYVYDYKAGVQKITTFTAKKRLFGIDSLAVHPTQPLVLSSCFGYIQIWDWDKNWQCIRTFKKKSFSDLERELAFNPEDTNTFASASNDHTVKLWSLDSLKPDCILTGHTAKVNCLYFFTRDDNKQYLITGSSDKTAKIWDMREKTCVHTLEGFMSSVISVVSHPSLPVLITGTRDCDIHLWSATNFRLKLHHNIGGRGGAHGLACIVGSRRVVIGNDSKLFMMEINDDEPDAT